VVQTVVPAVSREWPPSILRGVSAPSDGASPPPSDADPNLSRSLFARATPSGEPARIEGDATLLNDDLMASVPAQSAITSSANASAPPSTNKKPKQKRGSRRAEAKANEQPGQPVAPTAKPPKRKRPRRSWAQRGIIGFNILLVLICIIAAGGMTYVKRQIADVKRIDLGQSITDQANAGDPVNFLMVGIDNDFGLAANDPVVRGRDVTLNTDTIMVLRIDPASRKAWVLSLPRDLYVPIPGTGSSGRINTALSSGGPGKLVETIKADFGITINHYVQVNFAGFEQLVDTLGGVPIYFDKAGRDTHSGLAPTGPGCVTLDGAHALQFVRSRYYEVQTGPFSWEPDPTSDLGRVARQQEFIRGAMKKAIDRGARNPYTLSQLIGVAQQSVQIDKGVTTQMLLDIGDQFRDFDPDSLQVMTPPADGTYVGAAAVLLLNQAQAQPMFDIFRGVNPTLNIQRSIRVDVRSGSGALGRAKQVQNDLAKNGFVVQSEENPLYKSDTTIIRYAEGNDDKTNKVYQFYALVLARFIDGPVTLEKDPSITGDYPIDLVVGSDWHGVRDVNNPRPLSDFRQYLPPELLASADQPESSTTVPITLPPPTVPADVPTAPPGTECH
jgi:LCP family protein required for cell wall assembly